MTNLIKQFKIDRYYHYISYGITLLLVLIYFVSSNVSINRMEEIVRDSTWFSFRDDLISYMLLTNFLVLIVYLIKWGIREIPRNGLMSRLLPFSEKDRLLYDILSGIMIEAFAILLYFVSYSFLYSKMLMSLMVDSSLPDLFGEWRDTMGRLLFLPVFCFLLFYFGITCWRKICKNYFVALFFSFLTVVMYGCLTYSYTFLLSSFLFWIRDIPENMLNDFPLLVKKVVAFLDHSFYQFDSILVLPFLAIFVFLVLTLAGIKNTNITRKGVFSRKLGIIVYISMFLFSIAIFLIPLNLEKKVYYYQCDKLVTTYNDSPKLIEKDKALLSQNEFYAKYGIFAGDYNDNFDINDIIRRLEYLNVKYSNYDSHIFYVILIGSVVLVLTVCIFEGIFPWKIIEKRRLRKHDRSKKSIQKV